jgi:hypothetical protein
MPSHPDRVRRNYPEGVPQFGAAHCEPPTETCGRCYGPITDAAPGVALSGYRRLYHVECAAIWTRWASGDRGCFDPQTGTQVFADGTSIHDPIVLSPLWVEAINGTLTGAGR